MTNDSGAHLTTSRIARLFRPLRAKCLALATPYSATTRPRHSALITYSNSSRNVVNSRTASSAVNRVFSLKHIPPPERLSSTFHFDQFNPDFLREISATSSKMYEVRDAFRNTLKAAYGGYPGDFEEPTLRNTHVLGLASMCASMVGDNLEAHLESCTDESEGYKLRGDAEMDAMDELYEAVPQHYRRYTMASHALSYILNNCPHYPTLLMILLDVTLAYKLAPETHFLLHAIFRAACKHMPSTSTSNSTEPQIADPAYCDYFLELREKCCGTQPGVPPIMTDGTFARIISSAFAECERGLLGIWNSPAVMKLFFRLRSGDLQSFVPYCIGLSQAVANLKNSPRKKQEIADASEKASLEDYLGTWIHFVLADLHGTSREPDFTVAIEFLVHIHTINLHRSSTKNPISPSLVSIIIGLTTYCLASPLVASSLPDAQKVLYDMLSEASPTTDTYDALVCILLDRGPTYDFPHFSPSTSAVPSVRQWADALRVHGLYAHEASFCSSALRGVEMLCSAGPSSRNSATNRYFRAVEALRSELVERVEEAERLCFGTVPPSTSGGSEPGRASPSSGNDWQWEETMGCWVRKSPVVTRQAPRRPKMQRELSGIAPRMKRDIRRVSSSQRNAPASRGQKYATSETSSSSSSRSPPLLSPSPEPNEHYPEHLTPPSSPSPSIESYPMPSPSPPPRRISNFYSILADAQMSHTVLHTPNTLKGNQVARQVDPQDMMSTVESLLGTPLRGPCDIDQLSSDDLDLFAYSSPSVVRPGRFR